MSLFDTLARRMVRRHRPGITPPRSPLRRHWRLLALPVAVILAGTTVFIVTRPSPSPCGPGLTALGSPQVCVGLDLDSTAFRDNDPLAGLEQRIAAQNATITGIHFVTIVVLDNMTPDPTNDSLAFRNVRHGVQGAITGAWRANNQTVADGTTPPVKLLLASFGSGGEFEAQAVDAIVAARDSQHIVAVTDFGQSLDTSRKAASDLSDQHIASVGSLVSGDNINQNPKTGRPIPRFFRVTPTNSDAARATVAYLGAKNYRRVMLIQDTNQHDLYATTLATAFQTAYTSRYHQQLDMESYESPDTPLNDINRATYMKKRFADMHGDICSEKPDLIYFAGRGADLRSFLTALAEGGACGLSSTDVMSSDDATSILGTPLPDFHGLPVKVLYTGVATKDEWNNAVPPQPDDIRDYNDFVSAFLGQHVGAPEDLVDGYAILNHDAVLTAATAARQDPSPVSDPMTVADFIGEFNCLNPVPGAGGKIAFSQHSQGNPIDKVMPIMRIQPDGTPAPQDLAWATGLDFDHGGCR